MEGSEFWGHMLGHGGGSIGSDFLCGWSIGEGKPCAKLGALGYRKVEAMQFLKNRVKQCDR